MRRLWLLVGALVVAWLVLRVSSNNASITSASAPTPTVRVPSAASPSASAPRVRSGQSSVGFRTRDRLDEHFAKHGAEFGRIGKEQYLAMAQLLRDAEPGGDVLEIVRADDGVVSRFDKRTGAFLAYDRDGIIRTFFKPNDGEVYFRRQARRRPTP